MKVPHLHVPKNLVSFFSNNLANLQKKPHEVLLILVLQGLLGGSLK